MDRRARAVHAHPFSILTYLYKFLFLLIFPLLRGFLSALQGGLIRWVQGAWLDLLMVALILFLSYQKWNHFRYYFDISGLYYTQGIFLREQIWIPNTRISALSVLHPFWLRPFRIAQLRVDTVARNPKKADLTFYLRFDRAAQVLALRQQSVPTETGGGYAYRPGLQNVIFLSLFTSNSFIGILIASTFISQAGQILGQELSDLLLSVFEALAYRLANDLPHLTVGLIAFHLPPIAAGAALALIGGWMVAFTMSLLQTHGLCTRRTAELLHLQGGVLTKKFYQLQIKEISFIDIRQSLLTRLFRLYSVFLDGIGVGKEQSDIAAVIPFSTRKHAMGQLDRLLPEFQPSPRALKPNAGAIFKFLIEPLWPCILIPLASFLGTRYLPAWAAILQFAGLMLSIPAYWFLGVRLMDFFSSGVSKSQDFFTLRYSSGYYLHTVVIPSDKIALVNIRQSILQRGDNRCDLVVSTRAEGQRKHHIRNIDWDATTELFGALDCWAPKDAGIPNWYERLFALLKTRFLPFLK